MDALAKFHNWHNGVTKIKASLKKNPDALRIGVLGAAAINYLAILDPIETHPGTILAGIAARQLSKAQAHIRKYNLGPDCKAFGSYDALLDDPSIHAVYIPLPNGLHAEWAIKAMEKGKHVLSEKPLASNADEVRKIKEASMRTNKVALEAFHWRFHPASQAVREMVLGGQYGDVTNIEAYMKVPNGFMKKDTDIRFKYDLAGGACMDLTYVFSSCAYYASPDPANLDFTVQTATPRRLVSDPRVDEAMDATLTIKPPNNKPTVHCTTHADLSIPPLLGFIPRLWKAGPYLRIETTKAVIENSNFVVPAYRHTVTVTEKDSGKKQVLRFYKGGPVWGERGEEWWTTYRYQLEAFVDACKARDQGTEYSGAWMSLDESEKLMEVIDAVYDKAGLPRRGL